MTTKTYPTQWPYRNVLCDLVPELLKQVDQLNTYWAKEGLTGGFLHFRGTNTKKHTHINDKDVAGWLIAIANNLDRPVHPIIIGLRNPIRRTDHFHIIVGVAYKHDEYKSIEKIMNTSWKDGASRVMVADLNQEPYSPLEYIPAKHNYTRGLRNEYVPRRLLRLRNKKQS